MSKKKDAKKGALPVGAVLLKSNDEPTALEFVRRTGAEQYQEIEPGVWAYWPANANSKAVPNEGPFIGEANAKEETSEFLYFTHRRPDKDGVFIPARLTRHPSMLSKECDERIERDAKLPDSLRDIIELHRMNFRNGRA
jgi:hypothetical protein